MIPIPEVIGVDSMTVFRRLFLVIFLCGGHLAYAEAPPKPLKAERIIEKLSLLLRGRSASLQEKIDFKAAIEREPADFDKTYRNLIHNFMKDPGYAKAIALQHSMWWRIPDGTVARHAGVIVAENRPYREIYQRDYLFVDGDMSDIYAQYNVQTLADLPFNSPTPVFVPLAPQEARFRGLFSSPEFLKTYPDTSTNKNRKRSSQVFRIAFCETLQNVMAKAPAARLIEEGHGKNPDCIGCHRRLDPMARFFDRWLPPLPMGEFAVYEPNAKALGAVKLGGDGGIDRAIDGVADADVGKIVVAQPEFAACVGKQAWRFAFGSQVALDNQMAQRLATRYSENERLNPVIEEVLMHPYFWSEAEVPALHYDDVKGLLANCGTCHARASVTRFDPTAYPFLADADRNAELLGRMWKAINARPNVRPMPESPQPRLPLETIETLRSWIINGAQSDVGTRTLSDEQVEAILE